MARNCDVCGKGTVTGRQLSHAHNVTPRTWEVNLRRVRALVDGVPRRIWACARCLRSGKVQKPPVRTWKPESAGSSAGPSRAT